MYTIHLDTYPDAPGIYLMKDKEGSILYIGKAKSLSKRLKQYFIPGRDTRITIPALLAKIDRIDTLLVSSEKEALLLENHLIKKHKPPFNILLKDDKNYTTLSIDQADPWPRILLTRHGVRPKDSSLHFGPYPSGKAAREVLELMSQLFPLRQCSDAEFKRRKRPCLLYDIKRCIAPCVQKCTKHEYSTFVEGATAFLRGHSQSVLQKLQKAMEEASTALEFEQAASYLHTLRQIEQITQPSPNLLVFQKTDKQMDILFLHHEHGHTLVLCLPLREGFCMPPQTFFFEASAQEEEELLSSFLVQHYTKEQSSLPDVILLPLSLSDHDAIQELLEETHGRTIALVTPRTRQHKEWMLLAEKNAKAAFSQRREEQVQCDQLLSTLQTELHLEHYPRVIECIDTSHLSGSHPVAALVTFTEGREDRAQSKLYHIHDSIPGDDLGALRYVMQKRLVRAEQENNLPNLFLLDGGKTHLHTVLELLREKNIIHVDVRALSKEQSRHDKGLSQESLHIPGHTIPLLLPLRSPFLFFLQKIRDRTHDRAIAFQRKVRSKKALQTSLDNIPGIGPIKKKRLLTHFGSLRNLLQSPVDELYKVQGLTKQDISLLIKHLF